MASETITQDIDFTRPLPPELRPNVEHIVTEDDTPVDNLFSEKQQRLLTEPLYTSWPGPGRERPFVAMANVGLFYAIKEPPFVPDALLSLDVTVPADLWPKRNRSYFLWEYGKPPEVVVEVVSNTEGGEDDRKLTGYARLKIPYYVIFDPESLLSDQTLRGFQLEGISYQPMNHPLFFTGIGLGLELWQGSYESHENTWLRWVDADGDIILTGAEQRQRADQERQRADQERQRAERLAEQLRRLGAEPES